MPEGDTVYRTAHHLEQVLAGKVVTDFDIRVPGSATVDLAGETVRDVTPRGKHILHRIGEYTLHSHLRMEGQWHVYRAGAAWRRPAFQARAVVRVAGWDTVGFDLAGVTVVPTRDEESLVGHLGPDPLSAEWDPAEAARRVGSDGREAHVALLDQRNVAGFGNVYANELLFLRGIDPRRPIDETEARAVVDLGARTIHANLGSSRRVFTGDARPGRNVWVHGRDGKACRRCGSRLQRVDLGADPTRLRQVTFCPHCQT